VHVCKVFVVNTWKVYLANIWKVHVVNIWRVYIVNIWKIDLVNTWMTSNIWVIQCGAPNKLSLNRKNEKQPFAYCEDYYCKYHLYAYICLMVYLLFKYIRGSRTRKRLYSNDMEHLSEGPPLRPNQEKHPSPTNSFPMMLFLEPT